MTFSEYYNTQFREDLERVQSALPSLHQSGETDIVMQPRSISLRNPVIRGWSEQRRMLFASALFLTFLADQVCYTHFQQHYRRFRELTMYPKWRGDCPGGCSYHIHPSAVLRAVGAREGRLGSIEHLPFASFPDDLFVTMEREVIEFFAQHLPEISGAEFWRRCEVEIPVLLRMFYVASRSERLND